MSRYRVLWVGETRYVWGGDAHGWTWIGAWGKTYSAADAVVLAADPQSELGGERVYVEEVP